ncbi:MAG: hypothetical protein ACP5E3_12310 [Bacteroidales bacterium]
MITRKQRLSGIFILIALLLSIPLIAMQFTDEVNWTFSDFIIMGVLLLSTGLMCELVIRKVRKVSRRIAFIAAILAVFFLIWAELAVGIF